MQGDADDGNDAIAVDDCRSASGAWS